MEGLSQNVLKCFLNGELVMMHIPDVWNAIWSDVFIESMFRWYDHRKGGIKDVTLKT